jgi:hypothetical protein
LTWFADLTPYSYLRYGVPPLEKVRNVGWLDADHPFPTGLIDPALVDRLGRIGESEAACVNPTRGSQVCALCGGRSSNGEIWMMHRGLTYASPHMIPHYVEVHEYRPPDVYLEALRFGVVDTRPRPPTLYLSRVTSPGEAEAVVLNDDVWIDAATARVVDRREDATHGVERAQGGWELFSVDGAPLGRSHRGRPTKPPRMPLKTAILDGQTTLLFYPRRVPPFEPSTLTNPPR